jgi:hypothetical protein
VRAGDDSLSEEDPRLVFEFRIYHECVVLRDANISNVCREALLPRFVVEAAKRKRKEIAGAGFPGCAVSLDARCLTLESFFFSPSLILTKARRNLVDPNVSTMIRVQSRKGGCRTDQIGERDRKEKRTVVNFQDRKEQEKEGCEGG